MITLSVCLIVKNEEAVLDRCLQCIQNIADEIIIVDTGSTDRTKEIALKYTNNIYNFNWINDFSAARNFSFSKATKDYIMWIDADDVITKQNQNSIIDLKKTLDNNVDVVMMKYDVAFDENNNPTFSYHRERIVKRDKNFKWLSEIHEVLIIDGNIIYSPITISHKKIVPNEPQRNLKIFQQMIKDGKQFDKRQMYYYGRELYHNKKYEEAIKQLELFLFDKNGWIENNIDACKDLATCYFAIKDDEKGIASLLRSFTFDNPRAEICCEIGKYFISKKQYSLAIHWYKTATKQKIDYNKGGFIETDCYTFIPNIQLCLCYDLLGEHEKAKNYNERAGKFKPQNKSYLHNKNYFDNLQKNCSTP